ncbi:MAG: hypothetical protein HN991_04655, partial [Candidatus Jacksonbacteria bacterium]|nr:hypothetical protein [Candidatus Jacksonbacteria bacterium]
EVWIIRNWEGLVYERVDTEESTTPGARIGFMLFISKAAARSYLARELAGADPVLVGARTICGPYTSIDDVLALPGIDEHLFVYLDEHGRDALLARDVS